jgi:hypothetical protein
MRVPMDELQPRGPGFLRAFMPVLVLFGVVFFVTGVLPVLIVLLLLLFGPPLQID